MQYELIDFEDVSLPKFNPATDKRRPPIFKLLLKSEKGERIVAVESKPIPALENKRKGMILTLNLAEVHFGVLMLRGPDVLSVSDPEVRLHQLEIAEDAHRQSFVSANSFVSLDKSDVTIFAVVRNTIGSLVTLDDGLSWFECSSTSSLSVGHAGFFRLGYEDGGVCIRSHS